MCTHSSPKGLKQHPYIGKKGVSLPIYQNIYYPILRWNPLKYFSENDSKINFFLFSSYKHSSKKGQKLLLLNSSAHFFQNGEGDLI